MDESRIPNWNITHNKDLLFISSRLVRGGMEEGLLLLFELRAQRKSQCRDIRHTFSIKRH